MWSTAGEGAQKRKVLDKRKFKLRWPQASDHGAFNNIENVWANSCHGLPELSDKEPYQEKKTSRHASILLGIGVNKIRVELTAFLRH